MRVLARDRAEPAVRARDRVAAALDGEAHDVLGVEVDRVLGEARPARMLDALVDGEDGQVAGAAEAPGVEHLLDRAQHLRLPVGGGEDAVDEVASGQVEQILRDGLAGVVEERVGVGAEEVGDVRRGGGHRVGG